MSAHDTRPTQAAPPPRRSKPEEPLQIAIRLWNWGEWAREIIRGVQRFAHDQGNWNIHVAAGSEITARVLNRGVAWDGILTAVLLNIAGYKQVLREGRTKVVTFTAARPKALSAMASVRVDEQQIAEAIGQHLLNGGFRRFTYLGTVQDDIDDHRLLSMRAFCEAHDIELLVRPLHNMERHSTARDLRQLRSWVEKLPKPIGIVTWNVEAARLVVEALTAAGIDMPAQAAVVSWDDDKMIAETLKPTISCAVIPAERLGYAAAELLARLINGEPTPPGPILVQPARLLNIRQSSDVSMIQDRVVYLTQQYIRENAHDPIRVDDVARAMAVSRRKLEQDFKRVTEMTLRDAITNAHLESAKRFLLETDWPLERIAKRAGFGTKKTLHRQFMSQLQLTPNEYRIRFGVT